MHPNTLPDVMFQQNSAAVSFGENPASPAKTHFAYAESNSAQKSLKLLRSLASLSIVLSGYMLLFFAYAVSNIISPHNVTCLTISLISFILSVCLTVWSAKVLHAEEHRTHLGEDLIVGAWEARHNTFFTLLCLRAAVAIVLIPNYIIQNRYTVESLRASSLSYNKPETADVARIIDGLSIPIVFIELIIIAIYGYGAQRIFKYLKEPAHTMSNLVYVSNHGLLAGGSALVMLALYARTWLNNPNESTALKKWDLEGLLILGAISAGLSFVVWLINFRKWRVPGFITAILMGLLVIALFVLSGFALRSTLHIQEVFSDTSNMNAWAYRMNATHMHDIERFGCPLKYLPGNNCSGALKVNSWESYPDIMANRCLNTACAALLGGLYAVPMLNVTNLGLFTAVSGLLVVISFIYLYLRHHLNVRPPRKIGLKWLGLLLGLTVIIAVVGGVYFRPILNRATAQNASKASQQISALYNLDNSDDWEFIYEENECSDVDDYWLANFNEVSKEYLTMHDVSANSRLRALMVADSLSFLPSGISKEVAKDFFNLIYLKELKFLVLNVDLANNNVTVASKGDLTATYNDFANSFKEDQSSVGLIYIDVEGKRRLVVVVYELADLLDQRMKHALTSQLPNMREVAHLGLSVYLASEKQDLKLENVLRGITQQRTASGELKQALEMSEVTNLISTPTKQDFIDTFDKMDTANDKFNDDVKHAVKKWRSEARAAYDKYSPLHERRLGEGRFEDMELWAWPWGTSESSSAYNKAKNAAKHAADKTENWAKHTANDANNWAHSTSGKIKNTAHNAAGEVKDLSHTAAEKIKSAVGDNDNVEGEPALTELNAVQTMKNDLDKAHWKAINTVRSAQVDAQQAARNAKISIRNIGRSLAEEQELAAMQLWSWPWSTEEASTYNKAKSTAKNAVDKTEKWTEHTANDANSWAHSTGSNIKSAAHDAAAWTNSEAHQVADKVKKAVHHDDITSLWTAPTKEQVEDEIQRFKLRAIQKNADIGTWSKNVSRRLDGNNGDLDTTEMNQGLSLGKIKDDFDRAHWKAINTVRTNQVNAKQSVNDLRSAIRRQLLGQELDRSGQDLDTVSLWSWPWAAENYTESIKQVKNVTRTAVRNTDTWSRAVASAVAGSDAAAFVKTTAKQVSNSNEGQWVKGQANDLWNSETSQKLQTMAKEASESDAGKWAWATASTAGVTASEYTNKAAEQIKKALEDDEATTTTLFDTAKFKDDLDRAHWKAINTARNAQVDAQQAARNAKTTIKSIGRVLWEEDSKLVDLSEALGVTEMASWPWNSNQVKEAYNKAKDTSLNAEQKTAAWTKAKTHEAAQKIDSAISRNNTKNAEPATTEMFSLKDEFYKLHHAAVHVNDNVEGWAKRKTGMDESEVHEQALAEGIDTMNLWSWPWTRADIKAASSCTTAASRRWCPRWSTSSMSGSSGAGICAAIASGW